MAGHSLLRKLQNPALLAPRRQVSEAEVRESILEHLRLMCTTRAGTMLTCPDYGIADVSDLVHDFPDAIALLARSIRNTIQTYEPRLTNVVVRHVPREDRELVVRYEIIAHIQQQGGKAPIKFETTVGSSGNVTIE